ncbi:MAG TPA: ROK family protein [Actinocrinis sp.]|uniref:ROK family transcriptional regulator n=1 Tax=Actinocrinis sp. TaxID=1920516 RepID=UPI002DDCD8C3|nr:ROK family protein [Actinocrinis sp.]HEV2343082.1 ROK family protein [Actinocrinis sp.]
MDSLRTTGKATPADVRAVNRRLLLQHISEGRGRVSRADLVRLAGLNTATVSGLVAELLERGLVREVGVGPSIGGKPPILLDLDEQLYAVLGVQLIRDGFRIAALSLRGRIIEQHDEVGDPQRMIEALVPAVQKMAEASGRSVLAVGVAVPGIVDHRGLISRSVLLHRNDFDLGGWLGERLGYPVHLINDSDACALAEVALSDEPAPTLMALYVGDGVGAGLVLSGALFQGETFGAGEVGHLNLRTHTLRCQCGRVGCLEAAARISVLTGRPQSLQLTPRGEQPQGSLDDEAAMRAAANIAALLELVSELLDVRRAVICGPVCTLGPALLEHVRDALAENEPYLGGHITVEYSRLGWNGTLLGAAACAAHTELGLLWSMIDS